MAKSKALTSAQEEMEKSLANVKNRIGAPSGNNIKTKGKKFTLPNGSVTDGPIQVVVVDWVSANLYWAKKFDPQKPAPPVCFAIGDDPRQLVPSANSTDKQAKECNDCAHNEFDSGDNGAKACKNTRNLAILEASEDASDPEAPFYTISVSPSALKNFDGYVSSLAAKGYLPVQVVTELSFDPNKDHPCLTFRSLQPNDDVELHWVRREEAQAILTAEPDTSSYQESGKASGGRRAKKAPAKGGSSRSATGNRRV